MDTVGPISRTAADCAMTLAAIAGYDPQDPYTWQTPVPDYLGALSGGIAGLKIGVIADRVYADTLEPEVGEAVIKAISALGELGATMREVSIPLITLSAVISSVIIGSDVAALNRQGIDQHLEQFDHNNQVRLLTGSILPAAAYQKATRLRHALRQ